MRSFLMDFFSHFDESSCKQLRKILFIFWWLLFMCSFPIRQYVPPCDLKWPEKSYIQRLGKMGSVPGKADENNVVFVLETFLCGKNDDSNHSVKVCASIHPWCVLLYRDPELQHFSLQHGSPLGPISTNCCHSFSALYMTYEKDWLTKSIFFLPGSSCKLVSS